jgi:hypothetical protein
MKYFPKTFAIIARNSWGAIQEGKVQIILNKEHVREILFSASFERSKALQKLTPSLQRMASQYTKRVQLLTDEILEVISRKTLIYSENELPQERKKTRQHVTVPKDLVNISPLLSWENSQLSVEYDLFLEEYQSQVFERLWMYLNEENELQIQLAQFPKTAKMYVPMDLDPWLSPLLPDIP